MCGIVGFVSRETALNDKEKLRKYFRQALMCDTVRGVHGTGVMSVTSNEDVNVYKKPLNAFDFLELARTNRIIDDATVKFMVGHNRWATMGNHTIENSHPFTHNNITLFHNGTLTGYRTLSSGNFNVDSEYIAHALSETDNYIEVLEKITGAYSLVWYNESEKTLNFARNEERPMFIATIKNSNSLIFASELKMIEWLAFRNFIEIEKVSSLGVGILLSIPLEDDVKSSAKKFTVKVEETFSYSSKWDNWYSKTPKTSPTLNRNYLINIAQGIEVEGKSFEPILNKKTKGHFGYLVCKYSNDFDIKVYIANKESEKYINKKFKVKVDSINNIYYGMGHILSEKESLTKSIGGAIIPFQNKKTEILSKCSNCEDEFPVSALNNKDGICEDCNSFINNGELYLC